jgi:hypothetical protein
MREAVSVIAEMRDSDRLRKFLENGSDRAFHFSETESENETDNTLSRRVRPCHASGLAKRS